MSVVRKHFWQVVSRLCGAFSRPRKYGLSGCMPAVVSSTGGSQSAGTSEPDGRRLWSRCSKKERKASRISSDDMVRMRTGVYERGSAKGSLKLLRARFAGIVLEQHAHAEAVLGDRDRLVSALGQQPVDGAATLLGLGLDQRQVVAQRRGAVVGRSQAHIEVGRDPLAALDRRQRHAPVARPQR